MILTLFATKSPAAFTVKPARFVRVRATRTPDASTVKPDRFARLLTPVLPAESTVNPDRFARLRATRTPEASTVKPVLFARVWATRTPEASTTNVLPIFLNDLEVIVPEISRFPNASVKSPEADPENGTPFKNIPAEDPLRYTVPAEFTLNPPDSLANVGALNESVTVRLPATVTRPPLVTVNIVLRFIFPNVSREKILVVNEPELYKDSAVIEPPTVAP